MSIYGYKKKTKPALWKLLPSEQRLARIIERETAKAHKAFIASKLKPRKRIRHRALRHREKDAEYRREAKAYIKTNKELGFLCLVALVIFGEDLDLSDVHHKRGRLGQLLLCKRFWMPVSRKGHQWIQDHPDEARKHGWLAQKGDWHRTDDL